MDLTSWYDDLDLGEEQRKIPGLRLDYAEWTKGLVHWQSVSWNNDTSLLAKSEFICDYSHGSLLMYSLSWSTFPMRFVICLNRIFVYEHDFLVRTVEMRESFQDISTCHTLKSSFNHRQFSLSRCLITFRINLSHGLRLGLIPYVTVCDWVTLRHLFDLGF